MTQTKRKPGPIQYKGRSLGIIVLTGAQVLIGVIHLSIGVVLLAAALTGSQATLVYSVYTVAFGLLVLLFAIFIWGLKKEGWIGTVALSVFVIAADTLTVLHLPSVPGIPTFAAPTEIGYSIIIIICLCLKRVRKVFDIETSIYRSLYTSG